MVTAKDSQAHFGVGIGVVQTGIDITFSSLFDER
jgi:hypothetical protein